MLQNSFISQHEILATGCISALRIASNSFKPEAYRAALCLELDLLVFLFVVEVVFECVVFECVEACDEAEDLCDVRLRDERLRVCGASATGCDTRSVDPVRTAFERR